MAQDGRGGVSSPKEQAAYLERYARDDKNPVIEDYKSDTGLDVIITSDEAWEEMFGPGSLIEQSAKSRGGKIYLPYSCNQWSENELRLALHHEGTHVMEQLGFVPYLELLEDVGSYIDFRNHHMQSLLKQLARHTSVSEDSFFDEPANREKVYDELCATLSGHMAADQYGGQFNGEAVKLSDFFRSEEEFNEFLNRLEEVQNKFNHWEGEEDMGPEGTE